MPGRDLHREPIYSIGAVGRRTGLKPDLIRAWERRYGVLDPRRSRGGRRLYSEADVERLTLLARLTKGGHSIGQIAHLSAGELSRLSGPTLDAPPSRPALTAPPTSSTPAVERCLAAVRDLDGEQLRAELERAAVELGRRELVAQLLVPLMDRVGRAWEEGEMSPAFEHLATAEIRRFLGTWLGTAPGSGLRPRLVVATPQGQRHELGALLVAVSAASAGWAVTYLGPDLPAEQIAVAVRRTGARAAALSVTCPQATPAPWGEIRELQRHLGDLPLLVGGQATPGMAATQDDPSLRWLDSLAHLEETLHRLASTRRG